MRYRIKQKADNIFIAQCKQKFFGYWESIDNVNNYVWYQVEKYSYNETLEQALKVIERYKEYLKSKNQYPKYYKD